MRIGIDLDNTIVNYNSSILNLAIKLGYVPLGWKGNKLETKKYLLAKTNGQENWNRLQGQIYGPYMKKAKVFDGFLQFLNKFVCEKNEFFIVSHKTKFGHYDIDKTPLRLVAIEWLKHNRIINNKKGILEENVFFLSSQKEKVKKIESLQLDFFIDDLKEVLVLIESKSIKKIHFQGSIKSSTHKIKCINTWDEISNYIEGYKDLISLSKNIETIINDKIIKSSEIKRGINSKVYKIESKFKKYALKIYPKVLNDGHDRLNTEINALNILEGFQNTTELIGYDKKKNIAIFDWIEGKYILKINKKVLQESINFINNLSNINKNKIVNLSNAKESCLRVADLILQIESRLELITKTKNKKVFNFIKNIFLKTYHNSVNYAEKHLSVSSFNEALEEKYQILSPSDFGFHNAILKKNNKVFFMDFEYFGWDDPAKLINDFIWHPGMKMTDKQKKYWAINTLSIFKTDKKLSLRVKATWPLYGLRWILIILKDVLKYNKILVSGKKLELKSIEILCQ